jgi:hypothetical protein
MKQGNTKKAEKKQNHGLITGMIIVMVIENVSSRLYAGILVKMIGVHDLNTTLLITLPGSFIILIHRRLDPINQPDEYFRLTS